MTPVPHPTPVPRPGEAVAESGEPALLTWPLASFKRSYIDGELADAALRGTPAPWHAAAESDFDAYVAERRGVRQRFDVPSTLYWYVRGADYLGTLVIRHDLTPTLAEAGGHVGYHIVAPWRRRGHATRMLAAGLDECRKLGLRRVLLTCAASNEPSRRVIVANGGEPDGQARGEDRFWIAL